MKREERQKIIAALTAIYSTEVCYGKGGFWIKGQGFITFAQARRVTGMTVPEQLQRVQHIQEPWGDYATIALLNGYKFLKR